MKPKIYSSKNNSESEEELKEESSAEEQEIKKEEEEKKDESSQEENQEKESEENKEEKKEEKVDESVAVDKMFKDEMKKLEQNILKTVTDQLEKSKPSKETKEKKANINKMKYSVNRKFIDVYTKRNGQKIKIEESDVKHIGKWLHAVASKRWDMADKFLSEMETKVEAMTTTSDGGLVPTILTDVFIDIQDDLAVIRPRATVLDLSGPGNTFEFNQVTGRPKMSWTGETVAKSSTSMTTNSGSLTPYKLGGYISVSMEMLQDAKPNIVALQIANLGRSLVREEEKAFAAGSGSGRPTGLNTYTYRTVSAGGTLDYADFTNAWSRLNPPYRDKAVWLMNSRTMGSALGMLR